MIKIKLNSIYLSIHYVFQPAPVNDFQKNVLIAAASQAMGTTTQKMSEAVKAAGITTKTRM